MKLQNIGKSALLAGVIAVPASLAQTVTFVSVGDEIDYVKNSSGAPVADTSNPYGNLDFMFYVQGTGGIDTITAPVVTLPSSSTFPSYAPSFHNGGTLLYNSSQSAWEYGSPNGNNFTNNSPTNMNSWFPTGNYSISVQGNTVNLNLNTSSFPDIPDLTFSQGTWSNGKLLIDPTQSLTITSSSFSTYVTGGVGGYHESLLWTTGWSQGQSLYSRVDAVAPPWDIGTSPSNDEVHTSTLIVIPANTLIAGTDYNGKAVFEQILDYNTTGGSVNEAFMVSQTSFTVEAIPEPSAYATILGLSSLVVGVLLKRKRR